MTPESEPAFSFHWDLLDALSQECLQALVADYDAKLFSKLGR